MCARTDLWELSVGNHRMATRPLIEILFVVLCGSICGAESWRDFVLFGESKIDLLKEYYPFSNGIACKDTFARVFAVLDPEAFKPRKSS